MPLVDVQDLTFAYAGKNEPVLNKLSLEIAKGSFSIITGLSGCGKSTLGKALAGYLFQNAAGKYSGTISVNGMDMTKIPLYEASQRVAYVQQNPEDQFCTLTVVDEIAFGLENNRLPSSEIEKKIDEALTLVSGTDLKNRNLSTLSGGEKQKIAIAAMFALSPDVLILDEPTSNLDPAATEKVFKTLDDIRQKKQLTIIIIEHKLNQLTDLHPDILFMTKGKIIKLDSVSGYWAALRAYADEIPSLPAFPISASTDEDPLLVMKGVSIKKSGKRILKQIDLEIKKGDFIALMGPNGSGKTTLLQGIAGLAPTETGKRAGFGINLDDQPVSQLVSYIGYIFQNPDHQLFSPTVWEEVTLTARNLGLLNDDLESRAEAWLQETALCDRRDEHPQRLSYGEKRRLNLMSILLHEPVLLLIDELLIGQDLIHAEAFMTLLKSYADSGHAVILVNHQPDLAQTYCSRLLFLEKGCIRLDSPLPDPQINLRREYLQSAAPEDAEAPYAV